MRCGGNFAIAGHEGMTTSGILVMTTPSRFKYSKNTVNRNSRASWDMMGMDSSDPILDARVRISIAGHGQENEQFEYSPIIHNI